MAEPIKHERILLERRARVTMGPRNNPRFEMYCTSRDLSISGIFLNSECLLRTGVDVEIELEVRAEEWLLLIGRVVRRIEFTDREHPPGIGVQFGALSPKSRETLLRYFVTDRIVEFTKIFRDQFPHLNQSVTEQDLALVVNLWEDNRHHLVEETRVVAPIRKPPPMLEQPMRAGSRPMPSRPAEAPRAPKAPPPPPPSVKVAASQVKRKAR